MENNSDYQLSPNLILDLEKEKKYVIAVHLWRHESFNNGDNLPIWLIDVGSMIYAERNKFVKFKDIMPGETGHIPRYILDFM